MFQLFTNHSLHRFKHVSLISHLKIKRVPHSLARSFANYFVTYTLLLITAHYYLFTPCASHLPSGSGGSSPCTVAHLVRHVRVLPFLFSPTRPPATASPWPVGSGTRSWPVSLLVATKTRIRPVLLCWGTASPGTSFPARGAAAWWTESWACGWAYACANCTWAAAVHCCLQEEGEEWKEQFNMLSGMCVRFCLSIGLLAVCLFSTFECECFGGYWGTILGSCLALPTMRTFIRKNISLTRILLLPIWYSCFTN